MGCFVLFLRGRPTLGNWVTEGQILKTGFFGGGAVIGASIFFAALASGAVVPNHTNNGSLGHTDESNIVQENTQVADAAELTRKFSELNYYLPAIREGREDVPRFILAKLPSDLVELNPVKLRKELFIQALLPIVLQANEEILIARSRLIALNAISFHLKRIEIYLRSLHSEKFQKSSYHQEK